MSLLFFIDKTRIDGVFMLTKDDLLELDGLLIAATKEFDSAAKSRLTRRVNKEVAERKFADDEDEEKLKERKKTLRGIFGSRREVEATISCHSGHVLTGRSFHEIIDEPDVKNEWPTRAEFTYSNDPYGIQIEILDKIYGSVQVSILPHDAKRANQVRRNVHEWFESKRQVEWWRRTKSAAATAALALCFCLAFLIPAGLLQTISERPSIERKARALLENGIDSSEADSALEILLKLQTKSYAERLEFRIEYWYTSLAAIAVGLFVFWLTCPKSLLGIGRYTSRVNLYRHSGKFGKSLVAIVLATIVSIGFQELWQRYTLNE